VANDGPLAGMRVLDLTRLLPGAWCTRQLADLGAEVVKIETPLAGDYLRMAPAELGFGGLFEAFNAGKRSVAVNYRLPRGREMVLRLAQTADVFIEAGIPGQLARRGLGAADVRGVNPRLVYCSLSSFGQEGAYRERPAHDLNSLATAGILPLLGDGVPGPPAIQLADLAGGTLAVTHILAALVQRELKGVGATLDVAILDAIVPWLSVLADRVERDDWAAGALSGRFPCYGAYQAQDGRWLVVGALEPPFWVAFCRAVERDDLVPRQFDPGARDEVAAIIARRPADQWLETLGDIACVSPVNTPAQAINDPQVVARGLVHRAADGSAHVLTRLRSGVPTDDALVAPALGQDTLELLGNAGVSEGELAELTAAGVIAGRATAEATARAKRLGSVLATLAKRAAQSSQTRPS
jgi:crotonobetainyl-CoA:carnitine CoA-transferase CaiB-like acyl-CoA transferase